MNKSECEYQKIMEVLIFSEEFKENYFDRVRSDLENDYNQCMKFLLKACIDFLSDENVEYTKIHPNSKEQEILKNFWNYICPDLMHYLKISKEVLKVELRSSFIELEKPNLFIEMMEKFFEDQLYVISGRERVKSIIDMFDYAFSFRENSKRKSWKHKHMGECLLNELSYLNVEIFKNEEYANEFGEFYKAKVKNDWAEGIVRWKELCQYKKVIDVDAAELEQKEKRYYDEFCSVIQLYLSTLEEVTSKDERITATLEMFDYIFKRDTVPKVLKLSGFPRVMLKKLNEVNDDIMIKPQRRKKFGTILKYKMNVEWISGIELWKKYADNVYIVPIEKIEEKYAEIDKWREKKSRNFFLERECYI